MTKSKAAMWLVPATLGVLLTGATGVASADSTGLLGGGHGVQPHLAIIQPVTDLGPADTNQILSVSIVLKMRNTATLSKYIQGTVDATSPNYHKFLTVDEFKSKYAPAPSDVNKLVNYLNQHGLQSYVLPDGLVVKVNGPASVFEQLFKLQIENFSINGQQFYSANNSMLSAFPKQFQPLILTTVGLDSYAATTPMNMSLPAAAASGTQGVTLPKKGSANHIPGQFTSGDVANLYGVNPLYKQGITGKGRTIGIATFANFRPSDAYKYWNSIHLKTKPGRIRQVIVDGGGAFGKKVGSIESALDVEQSGGLAPDANIVVYDGANTDQGFVDVFYQAASDNTVDSLSVSWGSPELFYMAGNVAAQLKAMDQAFMELAAQGISTFASSGDSGAYDVNAIVPYPFVSKTLSVDAPSSDPYVTAAGGTSLPGTFKKLHGWVTNPETRAWSWDYMTSYMDTYYGQFGVYQQNVFPVGSGGGVSSMFSLPWYQKGINGIQKTAPTQRLIDFTTDPPSVYYQLKGGFGGRNTPDISLNADPNSGYLVYSSVDGGWVQNIGGTSLAAPQLNGMTALLGQSLNSRLGLLNPALYALSKANDYGPGAPLQDITAGNNWYYSAIPGYDQASGVGSPNLASLDNWLKKQQSSAVAR